ncbi:MAG: HlyD family efflux transporter periplasmic adaptor subunit [Rhodopila sp.]|nr:HlyD family efflux transporter periplasmic adaptor subunit [Rhodopila sp.]
MSSETPKPPTEPQRRPQKRKGWTFLAVLLCILALGGAGGWYWWQQQLNALPPYIAEANGRLEAEQAEISTKFPGRIAVVLAKEGDMVDAGAVVARMDTVELEAQLRSAQAEVEKAQHEKVMTEALIAQRDSERIFATQELQRTTVLAAKGWAPIEQLDQRRSQMRVAQAAYDTAVAAENAAGAQVTAGQADVARLKSQISDSTLVASARGRIQYKLAEPGEVLPAGGRVLTLLDLSDVYLTIFVPARVAGSLTLGDEARVTLDPDPESVFPAKVTFVATEAQFTPKTVETAEEREKLMFRVKLSAPAELLTRYVNQIKTGVRGIGFVRTDRTAAWPDRLAVKLPQ